MTETMVEQGLVHSVVSTTLGSRLSAVAAVAATTLTVDDVSDFNEFGGVLSLNGVQYTYTSVNFDTRVITLSSAVTVAGAVVDRVEVWPLTPQKHAFVVGAGVDDALSVRVPHALMDRMPEGIRDEDTRESVQYLEQAGELVITDVVGKEPLIDGSYLDPTTIPPVATDGNAPASSPAMQVTPGIKNFLVRFTPVANADPVTYDVHVSDNASLASIYGPATLYKSDVASFVSVGALPGPAPAPGQPDLRTLLPGTNYYFLNVARDGDGAAAPSAVVTSQLVQVTGPDVAANTITGDNIAARSITGAEIAAEVFLGTVFKTAAAGQRTEFGINGIQQYRSDESVSLNFPNDGGENLIDAEVIARGLTVEEGASFKGTSELRSGAYLVLTSGLTAPSVSPQLASYYETVHPNFTAQLGPLGLFNLVPSEVSFVEWNTTFSRFHIHQVRANGTRVWKCNAAGVPATYNTGDDIVDWKIYGQTTIPSGANAGGYNLFNHIPGGPSSFWISGPGGLNSYTRTNTSRIPALGNSGLDLFVAEALASNAMRVGYHVMAAHGAALPAAHTTYTTPASLFGNSPVYAEAGNFDFGGVRHVFAERGVQNNAKSFVTSGATLVQQDSESWESPVVSRLGQCWDGTRFWTYGSDGNLYKHTGEKWNPSVTSSVYWAKTSYYDSNATGGTHETALGAVKSITAPRRGSVRVQVPVPPPGGGADDPNNARLYMARGATQPADSALKLQYTGTSPTYTFSTLATATASHTEVPFPSVADAKIVNTANTLLIDGSGNVGGSVGSFAALNVSGVSVLTDNAPYSYARYNAAASLASGGTYITLPGWTVEANVGITHSSGVFTVPKAGRYRVDVNVSYAANATGYRGLRILVGATGKQTVLTAPSPTLHTTVGTSRVLIMAASGTITIQGIQNSGAGLNVQGDADGFYTNVAIEFLGT